VALNGPVTMRIINNTIAVQCAPSIIIGWFFNYTANLTANIVPSVASGGSGTFVRITPTFT
jgi:hypothetical protein